MQRKCLHVKNPINACYYCSQYSAARCRQGNEDCAAAEGVRAGKATNREAAGEEVLFLVSLGRARGASWTRGIQGMRSFNREPFGHLRPWESRAQHLPELSLRDVPQAGMEGKWDFRQQLPFHAEQGKWRVEVPAPKQAQEMT